MRSFIRKISITALSLLIALTSVAQMPVSADEREVYTNEAGNYGIEVVRNVVEDAVQLQLLEIKTAESEEYKLVDIHSDNAEKIEVENEDIIYQVEEDGKVKFEVSYENDEDMVEEFDFEVDVVIPSFSVESVEVNEDDIVEIEIEDVETNENGDGMAEIRESEDDKVESAEIEEKEEVVEVEENEVKDEVELDEETAEIEAEEIEVIEEDEKEKADNVIETEEIEVEESEVEKEEIEDAQDVKKSPVRSAIQSFAAAFTRGSNVVTADRVKSLNLTDMRIVSSSSIHGESHEDVYDWANGWISQFRVNGVPGYCIEPMVVPARNKTAVERDLDSVGELRIWRTASNKYKFTNKMKRDVNLAAAYGYGYPGRTSDRWIWATQKLIWEDLGFRFKLAPGNVNVQKELNEIKASRSRHDKKPSWHNKTIKAKSEGARIDLSEKHLSDYRIVDMSSNLKIVEGSKNLTTDRLVVQFARSDDRGKGWIEFEKKMAPAAIKNSKAKAYQGTVREGDTQDTHLIGYISQMVFVPGGVRQTAKVTLEHDVADLALNKIDNQGVKYPGTVFEVTDNPNGGKIQTVKTDSNGIGKLELYKGTYYIREKSVPSPLIIDRTWKKITVNEDGINGLDVINKRAVGRIEVNKKSEDGSKIAGAKFDVIDTSNNKVVDEIVTGSDGTGTSKNLPLGRYAVIETFAPKPYINSRKPVLLSLDYKDADTPVVVSKITVTNKVAKGRIEVDKKSTNNDNVQGAKFEIVDSKGKVVEVLTTNASGKAKSKELPLGEYKVREIFTPEPYVLDPKPKTVVLKYEDQDTPVVEEGLDIKNEFQRSDVIITKIENDWDEVQPQYNGQKLKGAEIELYAAEDIYEGSKKIYSKDQSVGVAVTDNEGVVKFNNLPLGKYYAEENKAPVGFLRFEGRWNIDVKYRPDTPEVKVTKTTKTVDNQVIYGKARLVKHDEKWQLLDKAVFGVFTKDGKKLMELTSNIAGRIVTPNLRYGEYYFQEIEAPEGYWLDDKKIPFTISEHEEIIELTAPNYLIKARLLVNKLDSENGEPIEGVKFKIWDVQNDDWVSIRYGDGLNVIEKDEWVTDENGQFLMEATIPYGKYKLVEVEAPEGYLLHEPIDITIDKNQDYYLEEVDVLGAILPQDVKNDPIRSEIHVAKVDKNTGDYLPDFKFKLTNLATGEETEHVTGKDGIANLGSQRYGWYQVEEIEVGGEYLIDKTPQFVFIEEHDIVYELTFENEQPVGELVLEKVDFKNGAPVADAKYGLFNLDHEIVQEGVTDESGTIVFKEIPLGKYYVKELETPEGYVLDENDYHVSVDYIDDVTPVIYLEQDVKEWRVPEIGTEASYVEADKKEPVMVTIVDQVHYENLVPGREYTVEGHLMNKETNEPIIIDGEKVEGSTTFVAESIDGMVEVEFTFDVTKLQTKSVVVFEDLIEDGIVVAVHHDINDEDQTVDIPEIGTEASFHEIDEKEPNIATIVDVVRYENLNVGETYVVSGFLMDKETNEPIIIDGKKVEGSTTFVPEERNGEVEVEFTLDLNELETDTIVVFEDLYNGDRLITVHHDINDEDQTVRVPDVGTEASFVERDKKDPVMVTLVDEVRYENLIVGKEYEVSGHLMDKETNEPVLIDGKRVEGSTTFIAEETEGIVEVEFTFDASKLMTDTVVVFEDLYDEGRLIAVHHDINDEDQTVRIPDVKTEASFVERDERDPVIVTLVDEVRYENLNVGEEYTVEGFLMDKETNEPVLIDGKKVEGSTTFIAEEANGTVEVEFTFDASKLFTKTVVVFEDLYQEDRLIAFHHDINDEAQTVEIPEIGTEASFVEIDRDEPNIATIVDQVHYEGLIVGEEYEVTGVLMDKETNAPVIIDGEEVTGSTTFIAEESEGTVEVEFTLDLNELKTDTVVVFEDLYQGERLIAVHHDINDKDQTVKVPNVGTKASHAGLDKEDPRIITIVDEVHYENLIVGKEYTVEGFLMDKETNEPIIIDGKKVEGSTTFIAEETEGTVEVEFTFDVTKLNTKSVVVFEDLYEEDRLIAVHHDINDEDQTVDIPEIGTTASIGNIDEETDIVTIIDEVRYENLIPGKEYTVKGKLMDKHTGKPIMIDGKYVEGSTTFVAESSSGSVNVEFTFDRSKLKTDTVVVFEDLYDGELLIAVHHDINDQAQTVEIPEPVIPTGDEPRVLAVSFVTLALAGVWMFINDRKKNLA